MTKLYAMLAALAISACLVGIYLDAKYHSPGVFISNIPATQPQKLYR